MRIATLVLGLIFFVLVLLQSVLVRVGGLMFDDTALIIGGLLGMIVAILFVFGAVLAMVRPVISLLAFGLAGLTGIITGLATGYTDLIIWSVIALALAGMSYYVMRIQAGERLVEAGEQVRTTSQF